MPDTNDLIQRAQLCFRLAAEARDPQARAVYSAQAREYLRRAHDDVEIRSERTG